MTRKDIALPGLALAGGLLCFGLRRWQLASAFHPETGLFTHGAPATWALLALTAALLLALFLLVRGERVRPDDFLPAFSCAATGHMALLAAAALLLLAGGALSIQSGLAQLALWRADPENVPMTFPAALLLVGALCLPAGAATLLLGQATYRGELSDRACLLAPFSIAASLIWLFVTHLEHGVEPVLLTYCFPLAAAAFLMLSQYETIGFLYGRPHRRRALFFSLGGVLLGLTALADGLPLATSAITLAYTLSALAMARALLQNSAQSAPSERMPSGAQEEMDTPDTQTE